MHSCCSGLSCLTAVSRATLVMWSTTADSGLPSGPAVLAVGVEHVAGGHLEPVPAGLEVVGDQVAGDRDQPGAEVAALPGEAADALERAQERVRGQVLGELPVADPEVDEPEDGVDVPVVDQAERLGLAGLGPLDQRPHLGGRVGRVGPGRVLRRLGLGRRPGGALRRHDRRSCRAPARSPTLLRWPGPGRRHGRAAGRDPAADRLDVAGRRHVPAGRLVDVRPVAGALRAVTADACDDHQVQRLAQSVETFGECVPRRDDVAVDTDPRRTHDSLRLLNPAGRRATANPSRQTRTSR